MTSVCDSDAPTDRRVRPGFRVVTLALGVALVAAAAPSPLYADYARAWHFGSVTLTVVFALYAVSLLSALLVLGSLSDAVGRRAVIVAGLMLLAASMGLFLVAQGLAVLIAARLVQGVATALITAGVAAALIDLQPPARPGLGALVNAITPPAGLAVGGVASGALVQYAAAPFRTIYALILISCLGLTVPILRTLKAPTFRGPIDLRPRIAVPAASRRAFLTAMPVLTATWALGGLQLSLGPSLLARIAGSPNHLLGGTVVFALCAPAAISCVLAAAWPPSRTLRVGCLLLIGGLAVSMLGIHLVSAPALLVGTVIGGGGFGLGFLGAFRIVGRAAPPGRRGDLAAAVYVVAYSAFAVPAVAAGAATSRLGLPATASWYAAGVAVLALVALLASLSQRRDKETEDREPTA